MGALLHEEVVVPVIVSLAALGLAAVAILTMAGVLRWTWRTLERKERVHDARTAELLDRVMHVVNKTWTPPPYARDRDDTEAPDADVMDGIDIHPEASGDRGSILDQLDLEMIADARAVMERQEAELAREPMRVHTSDLETL